MIICPTIFTVEVGDHIFYKKQKSIGKVLKITNGSFLINWDDEDVDASYGHFDCFSDEGFDEYYEVVKDEKRLLELILKKKYTL